MHHTPPISMHARTHTYSTKRPKRSNRNWKQIPCAPQNLPKFSLQVSFSSFSFYLHRTVHLFMLLTISGETMCGGHQRTLSNRRLPSSQSKPTAVDSQNTSPSTTENVSQSLQNPTRRKRNWRKNQWGASTWCLPSQPLLATYASMRLRTCQQDRSPVLDGHARRHRQLHTSTRTSRDFSRTRRETCARAVATLPKSRPN